MDSEVWWHFRNLCSSEETLKEIFFHVPICAHTRGSQRITLAIIHQMLSILKHFETGFLLALYLITWLSNKSQTPEDHLPLVSPALGLQVCATTPALFNIGIGGQIYVLVITKTLSTDLSFQPHEPFANGRPFRLDYLSIHKGLLERLKHGSWVNYWKDHPTQN